MVNEMTICCCGASSWTRVIAWFQIVGNSLLLILAIVGLAGVADLDSNDEDVTNKSAMMSAAVAFAFIISFLGILMGVILLKGTNQKRVSYIKAWFIYGVTALAVSIIGITLNASGSSHRSTLGSTFVSGVLGIAINLFSLVVVYIHMKEINEGVFKP